MKGQIRLAGIISKIVKPGSDRFKVWEHFQGDARTRTKLDYHFYGMYGFMVNHDENNTNIDANCSSMIKSKLYAIQTIFW